MEQAGLSVQLSGLSPPWNREELKVPYWFPLGHRFSHSSFIFLPQGQVKENTNFFLVKETTNQNQENSQKILQTIGVTFFWFCTKQTEYSTI